MPQLILFMSMISIIEMIPPDDTSDDTIDREEKTFKLNLTGNQINIIKQDPYSIEISNALTSTNQKI